MRVLESGGPRRLALLLMPVLVAAGAMQPSDPTVPQPARGSGLHAASAAGAAAVPQLPQLGTPDGRAQVVAVDHVARRAAPDRSSRDRGRVRMARSPAERGRAALQALDYDWRALGYAVRFRGYTGGQLGTANRRTRTITVYVKADQSQLSLQATVAHELAHALDFEHGTTARRDLYRGTRGLSATTPWFPCNRCSDYASPAGDFAEVFTVWLVGPADFRSRLKGLPGAQELRDLAPLFELPPTASPRAAAASSPSPSPSSSPSAQQDRGLPVLLGGPPSPEPRARR